MADPRWWTQIVDKNVKITKNEDIYLIFFTREFSGSLITTPQLNSKNFFFKNGGFTMSDPDIVDKNVEIAKNEDFYLVFLLGGFRSC